MTNASEQQASAEPVKPAGKSWKVWLLLIFIAIIGYTEWDGSKQSISNLAQSILDDNYTNNKLNVSFIKIPIYHAVPFSGFLMANGILPSEYSGYFSIKSKDGKELTDACKASTIDYSVRVVGTAQISMSIPGESMQTIAGCQP